MIINYIKKEMITASIALAAFSVALYLYQSRSMDITNKAEKAASLEKRTERAENERKRLLAKKRENDLFLRKHPEIEIIRSKSKEFGDYEFERELSGVLETFFGKSARIKMNHKGKRMGNYVIYPVTCSFSYENPERVRRFFEYLRTKYIHKVKRVEIKNGKFRIECEFTGFA